METNSIEWKIDNSWTLFLDRDGTINKLLVDDYVKIWDEFDFIEGVLDALPIFNKIFGLTVIATNQQGVGKQLMSEKDLRKIHVQMLNEIIINGGFIDEIYYCPGLAADQPECRKPEIGMAIQATMDFPSINLRKSIMIGDTLTDMQFGKNAGMKTVLISQSKKVSDNFAPYVDVSVPDLPTFANYLASHFKLSF
jgi:histidinol-phosphate phosphatase family protein